MVQNFQTFHTILPTSMCILADNGKDKKDSKNTSKWCKAQIKKDT